MNIYKEGTDLENNYLENNIIHHGAAAGVTGSCHELRLPNGRAVLIDIGLFQGAEMPVERSGADALDSAALKAALSPADHEQAQQAIEFNIEHLDALILTHCHIDHVGRLPWLLIAGYRGPIYCTVATAHLLPLVIEDALKVGMTRNASLIQAVLRMLNGMLIPLPYNEWAKASELLRIRFRQAGHILGSSYVECDVFPADRSSASAAACDEVQRVVFSGDLGCKNSPLLPDPEPLEYADLLVLESTYGDKLHENRIARQERLRGVIEHCVVDRGAVLIPAFSIGRTQELLYELEDIIHGYRAAASAGLEGLEAAEVSEPAPARAELLSNPDIWRDILVVVDSPMAAEFTRQYRQMKELWDAESLERVADNRHPLNFARLHIVESHDEHMRLVNYLKSTGEPCIIIAASGMCTGGRMVNYLKALLPDPRTDVLFVGFQARGTPGHDIQKYGPRGGYVMLDNERVDIKAQVYTLGGYSAHADQGELIDFIRSGAYVNHVRLVHGEPSVQRAFATTLREHFPTLTVTCACDCGP